MNPFFFFFFFFFFLRPVVSRWQTTATVLWTPVVFFFSFHIQREEENRDVPGLNKCKGDHRVHHAHSRGSLV